MLLNSWSITLLICGAGVLFIVGMASTTAVKVLLYWDGTSDSEKQIELEGQTWLSAALVQYALVIQLISLVILVMAAEEFSHMIAGAMCATGSFLANEFGNKVLYAKIAGIFLYGFWIVLHRLDMHSEYYPLIRFKYFYLILLLPLVLLDNYWLFLYLFKLTPDVITSCCGVIFADANLKGNFISLAFSTTNLVVVFYFLALILTIWGLIIYKRLAQEFFLTHNFVTFLHGVIWLSFLIVSLIVITTFFSSYIYAMPSHNCPFDMLQSHYNGIGYPIYFTLFSASFLAMSSSFVSVFKSRPGLKKPLLTYQKFAVKSSLVLLLVFIILVSYPYLTYLVAGGES